MAKQIFRHLEEMVSWKEISRWVVLFSGSTGGDRRVLCFRRLWSPEGAPARCAGRERGK
jgi:hypothetical protein